MRRRLLKLTFIDDQGQPYHTCELPPRTARDLLVKNGIFRVWYDHREYPLHCLSYAEVARQHRAVVAKFNGDKDGHEIVIDTA